MQYFYDDFHYKVDIIDFYKNLGETKFSGLTKERIEELENTSIDLNKFFISEYTRLPKTRRYVKIMNSIKCSPRNFKINDNAEKFILFMLSVDPNFEAVKIYSESNKEKEIKTKMAKYFGLYDPRLVLIERFFIKHFLSQEKKEELNKEIEKRVYK